MVLRESWDTLDKHLQNSVSSLKATPTFGDLAPSRSVVLSAWVNSQGHPTSCQAHLSTYDWATTTLLNNYILRLTLTRENLCASIEQQNVLTILCDEWCIYKNEHLLIKINKCSFLYQESNRKDKNNKPLIDP